NTVVATVFEIWELDRKGEEVLRIRPLGKKKQFAITGACKDAKGDFVCRLQTGMCLRLDSTGKQIGSFNTFQGQATLDYTPQGTILLAQQGGNKVAEYDVNGKLLLDIEVPDVFSATGLANGNILATSVNNNKVMEVDRKGQVVWEYMSQVPIRARGR